MGHSVCGLSRVIKPKGQKIPQAQIHPSLRIQTPQAHILRFTNIILDFEG